MSIDRGMDEEDVVHTYNGILKVKSLSRVRLFATLWTVAHQAPPSMGFCRQEYWSGLPLPSLVRHLRILDIEGLGENHTGALKQNQYQIHERLSTDHVCSMLLLTIGSKT